MRVSPVLLSALASAPIPYPFTLREFCAQVQRVRGRRIQMHDLPLDAPAAVCGLWIATRRQDHIFVAPGAAGVLRSHIVIHEVSHMLLDHGRVNDAEAAFARLLGPVVQAVEAAAGSGRVRARSRYDTREEREAEELATMVLLRSSRPHRDGSGLSMIEQTFGYEGGGR